MGYYLRAFIGQRDELQKAAGHFKHARAVPLVEGLGLIPVTEELYDEVTAFRPGRMPYEAFFFLSDSLVGLGKNMSVRMPIAYVEADYFGGIGTQAALVWEAGDLSLGPIVTETDWKHRPNYDVVLEQGAINQALRALGARKGEFRDEFEAVGLNRHRDLEGWYGEQASG